MNFKQAIEEMKKGKKVRRKGWGDTWYIINNRGNLLSCNPNFYNKAQTDTKIDELSLINIEHILANDWEVMKEKKKWWKPEMGQEYYQIDRDGSIDYYNYDFDVVDKRIMAIGNCFQTKEQAKFMVEKLNVIHKLEKFAFENNEEEIDWNNENQEKYIITFNHITQDCGIRLWRVSRSNPFNVYFSSEELAKKAIETIGEERIKKYYFGVKDE